MPKCQHASADIMNHLHLDAGLEFKEDDMYESHSDNLMGDWFGRNVI